MNAVMENLPGIGWLALLLLGNAFFVAGEFAVMGARRSQIEPKAEAGSRNAKTTLYAMEHVTHILAICQLGITVCSLLILIVAEPAIHGLLAVPLESMGMAPGVATTTSFILALLVVTFLHVTFGEMVPKNAAVTLADKAVLYLAPPLVWIEKILRPVIRSLNWAANLVLRMMRVEPQDEVTSTYTLQEVQSIVEESTRTGLVEDHTGILSGALEFSEHVAADEMVPVDNIITLPINASPADFEKLVRKTGFSRFIIEDPKDDTYVGYLHLKDILTFPDEAYEKPIPVSQLRSMANVGLDQDIEDALALMQRSGSHMARVISPQGSTVGVLFLEDVIEVLIGEIHDATQSQTVTIRQKMGDIADM